MPGRAAAATDGADDIIGSVAADTLPSIGDSELRNEWRKLLMDLRSSRLETDLDERHDRSNFERAIEIALANADTMSVSTEPMGRRYNMTDHVRSHFYELLNTDNRGCVLLGPRPDVEYLLKTSELVYLYDSVARFCSETMVRPGIDGLENVRFLELPNELSRWMGEVDLLWLTVKGELAPEEDLREWIDRLHEDADSFVAEAKERQMFLPISGEQLDSPDDVLRCLSRNAEVSPEQIHNYCFTRATERFDLSP